MINKLVSTLTVILIVTSGVNCSCQEPFQNDDAGLVSLLFSSPLFLAELDLTEEQANSFDRINAEMRKLLNDYSSDALAAVRNSTDVGDRKEEFKQVYIAKAREFSSELAPHQIDRIRQVFIRFKVKTKRRDSFYPVLESLAEDDELIPLSLREKDRERLKEDLTTFENEMSQLLEKHRREIRELAEQHENSVLKWLPRDTAADYEKLLGPNLNFMEGLIPASKKKSP
jgi:flagellar motility protein MotE (MotC chaperone)